MINLEVQHLSVSYAPSQVETHADFVVIYNHSLHLCVSPVPSFQIDSLRDLVEHKTRHLG